MSLDVETTDLFEIPGNSPPAELQVYAPMGRIQLHIGQVIRYRYYETQACRYRLGVVTKNLGAYPVTRHPHYEISFRTPIQPALFADNDTSAQTET
jgi:hypothetical protein